MTKNCPNCGARFRGGICAYCGTEQVSPAVKQEEKPAEKPAEKAEIFISRNQQTLGPYPRDLVGQWVATGKLSRYDTACTQDTAWMPLYSLLRLLNPPPERKKNETPRRKQNETPEFTGFSMSPKVTKISAIIVIVLIFAFVILMVAIGTAIDQQTNLSKAQTNAPTVAAPPIGITLSNFNRLQEGMSYSEVAHYFGQSGDRSASSTDRETVAYLWRGRDGSSATVVFRNDRLISKTQIHLKD